MGFVISQDGTQFKRDVGTTANVWSTAPTSGTGDSAGVVQTAFDTFPFDPIGGGWSKMD